MPRVIELLALAALAAPMIVAAQPAEPWRATLVSVEGTVEARRVGQTTWTPAMPNETFEYGDSVRTLAYSRAAVLLPGGVLERFDQNTTVTFARPEDERRTWLEIIRGAVYTISRDARALQILTPFANAGIEGTEFLVVVTESETAVTVFEGTVAVENQGGQASVGSGQTVSARAGQAPVVQAVLRPRDAVQWTLYYSPALGLRLPAADDQPSAARAGDTLFYAGRAAARLAVGRVEEARADIDQALTQDSTNVEARSLQSIIALAQNDKEEALRLANLAVGQEPSSSTALVALSYAQQALFDLSGALASLRRAAESDPQNALVSARLSELWLAVGDVDQSLSAARTAVSLNPQLERTQTVLGFAYLTRVQIAEAMAAFRAATALDQAAPLPHLGVGLALIRNGELAAGRAELEIAVILDPGNALIRSYAGKAYYEEKRDDLAATQLQMAKDLDARDPTPWLYDAVRKQAINRPVEALHDLQRSIELNDNRAVYRSQLMVEEDLATRSASVGRIERDLGFEQLALLAGWKSVSTDPGNHSGHRLLADSYSTRSRHEVARVNELFQSQLLQPLNITPVQPQLAEANLFILDTAGPAEIAFNEFNPLFNRNRVAFHGSAVLGSHDTSGEDIVVAGIANRLSYSFGQFHFETDGFRENNDLEQDVLNGLVQFRPSEKTSLLAELRSTKRDQGDLDLLFDPQSFNAEERYTEDTESLRIGGRHAFSPKSELLGVVVTQDADLFTSFGSTFSGDTAIEGYSVELEHLYRGAQWRLATGARHTHRDHDIVISVADIVLPFPPFFVPGFTDASSVSTDSDSLYAYGHIDFASRVTLSIGASVDTLNIPTVDVDRRVNPKVGIIWEPRPGTTLRASAFRTLQASTFSRQDINPRLEPTHVSGFNQFFAGSEGEDVWRYGLGLDQAFSPDLYAGVEFSRRELVVPFEVEIPGVGLELFEADESESSIEAYAYWTPSSNLALSAEYRHEDFENDPGFALEGFIELETRRLPLQIRYFGVTGLSAGLTATYVHQDGVFVQSFPPFETYGDGDSFWVLDAFLQYRLARRRGVVSIGVQNLADEEFQFQDTDPANPRILPERHAILRATFAF